MIFWMNSKVFQNDFLTNEKDDDILEAQYVVASSRIRIDREGQIDNIISAKAMLFPDAYVCSGVTADEFRSRYFEQCEKNSAFISTLIKGSIEEGYNIILLCTHKERKLKYLDYLSQYIYIEFGYPVYEYKTYSSGKYELVKYDKEKVLKKCNKILKETKEIQKERLLSTDNGRKSILKEYKKMSKKELKKILKKRNLYTDGMDKSEMIDTLEVFM